MPNDAQDIEKIDIREIYKLLNNINSQNVEIQNDIKQLRSEIKEDLRETRNKINQLEEQNKRLCTELERVNKKLKKCNFVIFGLDFQEGTLIDTFITLVTQKLNVSIAVSDLKDIYNIPTKNIIFVELVSYLKKKEIFASLYKLKGTRISFAHELTSKEREESKVLVTHLKAAKSKNLIAKIKNNKLVVSGDTYTYQQLIENPIEFRDILNSSIEYPGNTEVEATTGHDKTEPDKQKKRALSDTTSPSSSSRVNNLVEEKRITRARKLSKKE